MPNIARHAGRTLSATEVVSYEHGVRRTRQRRKLDALKPKDFETWGEVLDYLDGFRVDMQEDGCSRWEQE